MEEFPISLRFFCSPLSNNGHLEGRLISLGGFRRLFNSILTETSRICIWGRTINRCFSQEERANVRSRGKIDCCFKAISFLLYCKLQSYTGELSPTLATSYFCVVPLLSSLLKLLLIVLSLRHKALSSRNLVRWKNGGLESETFPHKPRIR